MSLSDLAAIGSFISGIAVVFSFIFLGLQMRQANLNQRALMQQGRSTRSVETVLRLADPHASRLWVRARDCDMSMDEAEINSFAQLCVAQLLNWEDSYLQHRAGTLEVSGLQTDTAVLKVLATMPAYRAMWQSLRMIFGEDYRNYIDAFMQDAKPALPVGLSSRWKSEVNAQLAALQENEVSPSGPGAQTAVNPP